MVKNSPANAADARNTHSLPESGRSPRKGNGILFQYPCLLNSMAEETGKQQSMGFQRLGHD